MDDGLGIRGAGIRNGGVPAPLWGGLAAERKLELSAAPPIPSSRIERWILAPSVSTPTFTTDARACGCIGHCFGHDVIGADFD
jgi:hypothetical protein